MGGTSTMSPAWCPAWKGTVTRTGSALLWLCRSRALGIPTDGDPCPVMTSQRCSAFTMNTSLLSIPKTNFGCCCSAQTLPAETVVTLCFRGLLHAAWNELLVVVRANSRAAVLEKPTDSFERGCRYSSEP